jgi:hypothetical protein
LVANHQIRANAQLLPLIRTEAFAGPCSKILTATAKGAFLRDSHDLWSGDRLATVVVRDAEALAVLTEFCPLVNDLSFAGYIIAGGAPSWAVRRKEHFGYPGDIDIFPVVAPGLSNVDKHLLAEQSYARFLQEIQHSYDKRYKSTYNLFWFRNKSCTTIQLTKKGAAVEKMRLQFIHRVHNSVAEVLGGFDFPAAQVAYDGNTFQCTYVAMLALHTGVMPLDFSRISASWPHRLRKYIEEKGFAFLALALSTKHLTDEFTEFARGVRLRLEPAKPHVSVFIPVRRKGCEAENDTCVRQRSLWRAVHESQGASDYHGDESVLCLEALTRTNMRNILHDRPLLVTAADVQSFVLDAHGSDIAAPWSIFDATIKRIREAGTTNQAVMQAFYGQRRSKEAIAHCIREDWAALDVLTNECIAELQPLMERQFAECKRVRWSLCTVGDAQYGAFNPMPLKSRDFYGVHHNGSYATPTGQQKVAFLSALRKSASPTLRQLPKDLIRLILNSLDHAVVLEIANRAMGWSLC